MLQRCDSGQGITCVIVISVAARAISKSTSDRVLLLNLACKEGVVHECSRVTKPGVLWGMFLLKKSVDNRERSALPEIVAGVDKLVCPS